MARDPVLLQRQRHDLVSKNMNRLSGRPDILDPALACQPQDSDRLKERLGGQPNEGALLVRIRTPPGPADAL